MSKRYSDARTTTFATVFAALLVIVRFSRRSVLPGALHVWNPPLGVIVSLSSVVTAAVTVIEVEWGQPQVAGSAVYPVDVAVEATDRQGLLRDISEVFAKEKINVIGVHTQSLRGLASMVFTVELADAGRLSRVLGVVGELRGVRSTRRR